MRSMNWIPIVVVMMMIVVLKGRDAREMEGEYCDTETFRAECGDNEIIIMRRASYGRMKLGRCIEMGLGHLGCSKDVLHILDRRCSGRRVCEIRIPDAELESTRPCLKELKTYLDGSFACQSVQSFSDVSCPMNGWNLSLTSLQPTIHISNVGFYQSLSVLVRSHPDCFHFQATPAPPPIFPQKPEEVVPSSVNGKTFAPTTHRPPESLPPPLPSPLLPLLPPILVCARPGQAINVTLMDFAYYETPLNLTTKRLKVPHGYFQNKPARLPWSVPGPQRSRVARSRRHGNHAGAGRNSTDRSSCRRYAYLLDVATDSATDVVACRHRASNVFVSKGHRLKLVMDSSDLRLADGEPRDRFVLKFQALGCPDPDHAGNLVWFKRESPYFGVMGCHFEEVTWSVTCNDSHWSGYDRECPSASTPNTPSTTRVPPLFYHPPTPQLPPTKTPKGTVPMRNYSGHRFYEYYVDDASNRVYDVTREDGHRASHDLVASVILIVATLVLVVVIFLAIRRLRSRGAEVLEESPSTSRKTKKHLLVTCDGHVLLSGCDDGSRFCRGANQQQLLSPSGAPCGTTSDKVKVEEGQARPPSQTSRNHRKNRINHV